MKRTTYQPVTPAMISRLAAIVGSDNLSTAEADRSLRSHDVSNHAPHMSEVVVWPQTATQTAAVLQLANEQYMPVTPWGAGTSVEGNPIPLLGVFSSPPNACKLSFTSMPMTFRLLWRNGSLEGWKLQSSNLPKVSNF